MWKKITHFAAVVSMAFASPVVVKAENTLMNTAEKAQKLDSILGEAGARMHQDRPSWLGRILGKSAPFEGRSGEAFAAKVTQARDTFRGGWGI